ncbi:MAG: hypothetical protein ACFFAU_05160 [Candidatus Hodarchaeota archaeon]
MKKISESASLDFKQSEIASELERLIFELTESKVQVKFIQPFSGFSFEGFTVPNATKGSRTKVPYFIAEVLLAHSLIEDFTENIPTSLQDLNAMLRSELRSGELQPLHPFLHMLMKKNVFSKEIKDSAFSELENKRLKLKFNQLMIERISKLVKMAGSKPVPTRKKGNMTASEQILFKKIVDLVQFWIDEFIDI